MHCKALAPDYERAADLALADNITFSAVDCNQVWELTTEELCADIIQYPTLRVYRGDPKSFDAYDGSRTVEE